MRVLLVDHDSEGLEAIARAIRGVLELDAVTSKGDALLLLRQNTYDVLIACERCVDGSGLDLLGRTTRTSVPLKRIFAAAPERLQLLGPRLAPFKVQRTINYPIDLEELWLAIAQVTGGPNDETDGTIERVVLDERGIPSSGTTPRAPIPPRPPAPLGGAPRPASVAAAPPPPPAPMPSTGTSGRYATARVAQPAPEPPLRAPPPPRAPPPRPAATAAPLRSPAPPATPSDTGRMRAAVPPPVTTSDTGRMRAAAAPATTSDTGRMRAPAPPMKPIPPMQMPAPRTNGAARGGFADWSPESPADEDLASIAEQAKLGVQPKVVDEHSRLVKKRLMTAGAIAVGVAGLIVLALELYDPAAKERERAIAAEVSRMAEQQKVTDDLTLIEIDIENAIMNNDLVTARTELAKLVARAPNHARKDFLEKSIERADELAKLAGKTAPEVVAPMAAGPTSASRNEAAPTRARPNQNSGDRSRNADRTERSTPRIADRSTGGSSSRDTTASQPRTFGAPIGDQPRQAVIPLNAPINAPPTTGGSVASGASGASGASNNNFSGRTVEASDRAPTNIVPPAPAYSAPQPTASSNAPASNSGSAIVTPAPAAPAPAAAVDVTPAKLVKRVTPVAPLGVSRRTSGSVTVKFNIGTNGRVTGVEVIESTPPGIFDDAAQTAVRKWVYEPRKENGVAVDSSARAKLVFEAE
jgi:TonB family protein